MLSESKVGRKPLILLGGLRKKVLPRSEKMNGSLPDRWRAFGGKEIAGAEELRY